MKKYTYAKEDLDYIKDTLQILLNDVKEIYEASGENIILLPTTLEKKDYLLALKKDKIALLVLRTGDEEWENLWIENRVNFKYTGNCLLAETHQLEKTMFSKQQQPKMIINDLTDEQTAMIAIQFVVEYDHIRESLINYAQTALKDKKETMDKIRHIRSKYSNEVFIDLGQNNSMNMQNIELQEENGKKIGSIDFGNRLVKIITEGDIVLTRVEETKERVKAK